MRCRLKPKNHPIEVLPRMARPSKTLWVAIRWLSHTARGVEFDERNARAAAFARGQGAAQGHERPRHELDKALISYELGEIRVQVGQDVLRIIMLERPVVTPREIDEERQNLTERQRRLALAVTLACVQQALGIDGLKSLAEIVNIAEDSNQLVHRGSRGMWVDSWQNQLSIREPLAFSRSKLIPNSRSLGCGSRLDQNVILGQVRIALQAGLHRLHRLLAQPHALLVHLVTQLHHWVQLFPGHALGPLQHRLSIDQFRSVPVLLQDAPAALNWIVLAMIGRIIPQLDGLANRIGKLDHARQKLGSPTTTLWTIIYFDLEFGDFCLCLLR